jgi:hypothetical protein
LFLSKPIYTTTCDIIDVSGIFMGGDKVILTVSIVLRGEAGIEAVAKLRD